MEIEPDFAAMNMTETRMDIIKDEFKYRNMRVPIHHIDTRLKSLKRILGKLQKKHLDLTITAACNNLFDIVPHSICTLIRFGVEIFNNNQTVDCI